MSNPHQQFIGIDVSKETLDLCFNGQHAVIKNNKTAINGWIKKQLKGKEVTLCALESTGGYERLVRVCLQKANVPVHTAHPNRVHAFAQLKGTFAKTDRLDAKRLEAYARFVQPAARIDRVASKTQSDLKEYRLVQKSFEEELHASQCREKLLSGQAKNMVKQHITSLKKKIKKVHEAIQRIIDQEETLKQKKKLLLSFKGVGEKVSNLLICDCPELGQLTKPAIACLVGLAPKTQESGKRQKKARIQGGRFFVRKALYMAALVAIRHEKRFKTIYEKHRKNGKPAKVAIVAVMRKIIVALNAMVKKNEVYA